MNLRTLAEGLWSAVKKVPYWYLLVVPTVSDYFGMGLNQLALVTNGNTMPVFFPKSQWADMCADPNNLSAVLEGDYIHSCMTHATHLKFLCDWIAIGNPAPQYIMSVGDIFILLAEAAVPLGYYLWIALMIKDYNARSGNSASQ